MLMPTTRAVFVTVVTLAAFFMPQWASAQKVTGDVKAGEIKISMCIGCHGIKGYQASFPEIYRVPRISGQSAGYIASALAAYKSGERKHPTMKAIAASLSDQDMADMGAYYAAHGQAGMPALPEKPVVAPTDAVQKLLDKGACVACHGANFNKPVAENTPKIGGQYSDYLYISLKAYKTENAKTFGRSNAVMAGTVKQYNLAELKQLSAYIGSIDTHLSTVPQNRFR